MRTALVMLLLASGCRHPAVWLKSGSTPEALRADTYECRRDARFVAVEGGRRGTSSEVKVDENTFTECMEARGWVAK